MTCRGEGIELGESPVCFALEVKFRPANLVTEENRTMNDIYPISLTEFRLRASHPHSGSPRSHSELQLCIERRTEIQMQAALAMNSLQKSHPHPDIGVGIVSVDCSLVSLPKPTSSSMFQASKLQS